MLPRSFLKQLKDYRRPMITLTALVVGIHGLFILATTLLDQFAVLHGPRLTEISIDVPILIGVSLIYLSSLLLRRKQRAWQVAAAAYLVLLILGCISSVHFVTRHQFDLDSAIRALALPVVILSLLAVTRAEFVVRSDLVVFKSSLKFAVIVLLAALIYGVAGFELLDKHDFHQEFGLGEAFHRTIDQFDLTTSHPLKPHTRRARIFQDSLSVISLAALGYVAISLFSPLRSRLVDPTADRDRLLGLLTAHGATSEDFFKLWPHDKHYFFNAAGTAGIALQVRSGIALCVGDPVGAPKIRRGLIKEFETQCFINDWLPAFIHAEPTNEKLYKSMGYSLQKIGEEAVVDIEHFQTKVANNKYFRNIRNRFAKAGYTFELLAPSHHLDVLKRLKVVSDDWLGKPGRTERGFVMGYFSDEYMQMCQLLVARDAAGTIQAFMNLVPAGFDHEEATYDLLRHSKDSPPNINDFLLTNFIVLMQEQGYKRVNLGLSPLVGLEDQPDKSFLDNFLHLAYANGDRFYSFGGLQRFKNKYEPDWSNRYVVYKGGLVGFTRTINALLRAMQVKVK